MSLNLDIIKDGLSQRVPVSEFCACHGLGEDGSEFDSDTDPMVLLFDASAAAERLERSRAAALAERDAFEASAPPPNAPSGRSRRGL